MSPELLGSLSTIVTILVGGGGLAGAIYAWFKLRPETDLMSIEMAGKVVNLQNEQIDRMQREIKRLEGEIVSRDEKIAALVKDLGSLRDRVKELERKALE